MPWEKVTCQHHSAPQIYLSATDTIVGSVTLQSASWTVNTKRRDIDIHIRGVILPSSQEVAGTCVGTVPPPASPGVERQTNTRFGIPTWMGYQQGSSRGF